MSICFVVNPIAGKGKGKLIAKSIDYHMKEMCIPYDIRFTSKRKEAESISKCAAQEGFEKIVSVGGDGTIYEVINGLIGQKIVLGVIPAGTGNDFARSIGIERDLKKALDTIVYGEEKYIDCGLANGRYFINVAGVGFDTEILREVEKIKKHLSGKWAYLAGVFKTLFHYKHKKIEIDIDGKTYNKEILLMALANGKFYGGGMKISPDSDLEDGYIDICIIHKISKLRVLRLFPTIFAGKHINVREVTLYRAKKIKLNSATPLEVNLDGDVVGVTPLSIEVVPKAIKILIPRKKIQKT